MVDDRHEKFLTSLVQVADRDDHIRRFSDAIRHPVVQPPSPSRVDNAMADIRAAFGDVRAAVIERRGLNSEVPPTVVEDVVAHQPLQSNGVERK